MSAVLDFVEEVPQRFKLLSDADLAKLPPIKWRVKGVLPQAGLAAVYGQPGCGKSFLAMDLIQSIARGDSWFGYRTTSCGILYICLEGSAGLAGRVAAYRKYHGTSSAKISYLTDSFSLLEAEDVAALAQAIKASGSNAEIVVIDTLAQSAPGFDENSGQDMSKVLAAAKELQRLIGGLVLLIHHSGKDETRGLRGHSSLLAALDTVIEISRNGDARTWKTAKSKDSADSGKHAFGLDCVALGMDSDGEPITSCVILQEITINVESKKLPKSGTNQRIVWDLLEKMFSEQDPFVIPEGAPDSLPGRRACIRWDDAIVAITKKMPVGAKRQKERTQDAIKSLIGKGFLVFDANFIWKK